MTRAHHSDTAYEHGIRGGEEGVTLLELLIVTMIIGILTGIGIPTYGAIRDRAEEAAARSSLRHVILGLEIAYLDPHPTGKVDVGGVAIVDADIGSRSSGEVAVNRSEQEQHLFLLTSRANRQCVDAAHRRHGTTAWSSRSGHGLPTCHPIQLGQADGTESGPN